MNLRNNTTLEPMQVTKRKYQRKKKQEQEDQVEDQVVMESDPAETSIQEA